MNNALARSGGLLAVALIPGLAGISGADYADPDAFDAGFHVAVAISAGLLVVAAAMAFTGLKSGAAAGAPKARMRVEENTHCPTVGPSLYPGSDSRP